MKKPFIRQHLERLRLLTGILLLSFFANSTYAQYQVLAKREASNLYKADRLIVETSGCLNYALLDTAILTDTTISFIKDRDVCRVVGIFQPKDLKAGSYKVIPVMEQEDFYRVGVSTYIQTIGCAILMSDRGLMKWNGSAGTIFSDDQECPIWGVFSPVKLK